MSILATQVLSILEDLFPANPHKRIFSERYVSYKGQRLFFDFYIKELGVFVECQGRQHLEYVKHFHGNKESFVKQKHRDNLKIDYVQKNNLYLIRLYDTEEISKELILDKINKVFDSEYNFCD